MLGTLSLSFARTSTSWFVSKDFCAVRMSYSGIGGALFGAVPIAFILAGVYCWKSAGTELASGVRAETFA